MKTTNLIPPNTEYLELNFVGETATGRGNNQQYVMENLHDGTFLGTESRVGITQTKKLYQSHGKMGRDIPV